MVALEQERRILQAVLAGADLDAIERAIIDLAPVDEEQKSALWLYAEALEEQLNDGMLADHEPRLIGRAAPSSSAPRRTPSDPVCPAG